MSVATSTRPEPAKAPLRDITFSPSQLLLGAFVIAALISAGSLLFNHAIDYDPEGWIVYAREVFGPGVLNTNGFPAWKPLPVLLIGPLTLLTKGEGDVYYWLFITRACAILAVLGAAGLANRLGGRWAAVLAALFVVLSPSWFEDSTIGRDSAVSGALMVGVFLAHHRGWFRWSTLALMGIALLRPEATPLLLLYGVWLWRTRRLAWWFPAGVIAIIAFLWLVPTIFATGKSPASISLDSGGANTAVNAAFPFGAVIKEAAQQAHEIPTILTLIACLATAYGFIRRRRSNWLTTLWGGNREELVLLGTGAAWVLIVATETEKGFAGNARYLFPGVMLFFVVAAVVAARIAGSSQVRRALVLAVCAVATLVFAIHPLKSSVSLIKQRVVQVYDIRQELATISCPTDRIIANNMNNAYLSQILGRPLQDTISWHLPHVYFDGGSYFWFLYCRPTK